MIPDELLRAIRNDLPMKDTILWLGRHGPPSKMFEGYFRFLCPGCGELRATIHPRTNLAHCFCCDRNYNNIDLLIALGHDFLSAVDLLEQLLERHRSRPAESVSAR